MTAAFDMPLVSVQVGRWHYIQRVLRPDRAAKCSHRWEMKIAARW
jgi:hypothetical protein